MNNSVDIQPLEPHQAAAVARIHQLSQEGTFLTSLGHAFLTLLYKEMSLSRQCLAFVALLDDEVIGFITGTLSTGEMFKEIALKRPFQLTWLVFKRALTRPSVLWQAAQTFAYPGQANHTLPEAELLSLAVDPRWRNRHIGGRLIVHLHQMVQRAGVSQITVTVDAANEGALRFYRRYKYRHAVTTTLYGRPMEHLVLDMSGHDD